jgi:ferritin
MIKPKLQDAINQQINAELYSAYIYAAMKHYFLNINLKGFANWMDVQVKEETAHAARMATYINDRGGRVILQGIDAPPTQWKSPLDCFEAVLNHEQLVTGLINDLVTLAEQENDYATTNFLQWFVAEQVEEEASADEVVQQLKLMGDNTGALFMLDRELTQRVFVDPNVTP